jgi:organic radical activating enzyme
MSNIPKSFCAATVAHTFISPQSERRLCCASREDAQWNKQYIDSGEAKQDEYAPISLNDWWNSEYVRSIRLKMKNGEVPSQCEICNDNILNLHTYKQYFNETLFSHKMQSLYDSIDDEGYTSLKPVSFDYRVSNLCNFKCRMCGEELSSSWESEKRMLGTWNSQTQKWMAAENKAKIESFQSTVVEQELWDAVKENRIEEIYWVGGEPLMYDIHWSIMNYLVESGQSKNVVVRYNTNLSNVRNLYELLPYFKNVNVCASQDATGAVAEYIRTGLKWGKWLENFKDGMFLNDLFGMNGMVIDVTITLPGLFDMKNLMKLAADLGVKSYVKITFDFESSAVMSPMCLPHFILDPILDDLIAYERTLNSPYTNVYADTFRDMKKRQTFDQKYENYEQGIKWGKERYLKLEEHRKAALNMDTILSGDALVWWQNV